MELSSIYWVSPGVGRRSWQYVVQVYSRCNDDLTPPTLPHRLGKPNHHVQAEQPFPLVLLVFLVLPDIVDSLLSFVALAMERSAYAYVTCLCHVSVMSLLQEMMLGYSSSVVHFKALASLSAHSFIYPSERNLIPSAWLRPCAKSLQNGK